METTENLKLLCHIALVIFKYNLVYKIEMYIYLSFSLFLDLHTAFQLFRASQVSSQYNRSMTVPKGLTI